MQISVATKTKIKIIHIRGLRAYGAFTGLSRKTGLTGGFVSVLISAQVLYMHIQAFEVDTYR